MDNTVRDSAGAPGSAGGAVTEVSLSVSASSMGVGTVCADTDDFGLDASVPSTFDDDVNESVSEVSRSDDCSSAPSSSPAVVAGFDVEELEDDELLVADESDDGAEFVVRWLSACVNRPGGARRPDVRPVGGEGGRPNS
jgi:hypothetical protein